MANASVSVRFVQRYRLLPGRGACDVSDEEGGIGWLDKEYGEGAKAKEVIGIASLRGYWTYMVEWPRRGSWSVI